MPSPLDKEEIDRIMEVYDETGTYKDTAEETGYDQETVSKYVKQRQEENARAKRESETQTAVGETPEGFTAEPPSDPTDDPLDNPDVFEQMGEGDFIEWFFEEDGHGVRANFAKNLARNCDIRQEIPDKAEMANRIMSQKSGISNDADVNMIAENYWAAAQRWLEANGKAAGQGQSQGGYAGPGGEWVSGGDQGGQQNGTNPGGGWVSGGSQQNGGQQQGGHRRHQVRQNQRHPAPGQRSQSGQQQADPRLDDLRDEIKELKKAQMQMVRSNQKGDQEQVQSLKQKFQEMVDIQETLKQMQDDSGGEDQAVRALQKELQEMKRELERAEAEDSGGVNINGNGDGFGAIAQLAAQGDMDSETLAVMADAMGVTDPEVKKEEYKYKTEKERMQSRKELMDNFFDNLGDVSGDLVAGVLSALQGDDDDDDDGSQAGNQQQRPPGGGGGAFGAEEQRGPKPAGSQELDAGEIQIVGDGDDQQPPQNDDGGMSPARKRHQDALQTGDFRGPGGGQPPDGEDGQEARIGDFRSPGEEDQ